MEAAEVIKTKNFKHEIDMQSKWAGITLSAEPVTTISPSPTNLTLVTCKSKRETKWQRGGGRWRGREA